MHAKFLLRYKMHPVISVGRPSHLHSSESATDWLYLLRYASDYTLHVGRRAVIVGRRPEQLQRINSGISGVSVILLLGPRAGRRRLYDDDGIIMDHWAKVDTLPLVARTLTYYHQSVGYNVPQENQSSVQSSLSNRNISRLDSSDNDVRIRLSEVKREVFRWRQNVETSDWDITFSGKVFQPHSLTNRPIIIFDIFWQIFERLLPTQFTVIVAHVIIYTFVVRHRLRGLYTRMRGNICMASL